MSASKDRPLASWRGRLVLLLPAAVFAALPVAVYWGLWNKDGAAYLILVLAPYAAMCSLGLCMMGGSKSCSGKSNPAGEPECQRD